MEIKETSISTELFDATWNGRGWDTEIVSDIEGTVWDATLPAMGSDDAIAVLEAMTDLWNWTTKKQNEMEGI